VDTLRADQDGDHPEAVVDDDYLAHVRNAVSALDSRERLVLALRFGFLDDDPVTLREAGRRLGLSRERVRQIEKRALRRLRERLAQR
jgi:RNA polymerase primary sigma factor